MKNILVTGGCGFIGSNFVKIIIKDETEYFPVILDSLTYAGNENNLSKINNNSYDQIYDAHPHVFSVIALDNILQRNGLQIVKVTN